MSHSLSPFFYLNKDWGCVILREIDFLLKICWSIPCLHPSWKVHTWIEISASLNHRKKTKADGRRLIPRKHTETLVLLSITFTYYVGFMFIHKTKHYWIVFIFLLYLEYKITPNKILNHKHILRLNKVVNRMSHWV